MSVTCSLSNSENIFTKSATFAPQGQGATAGGDGEMQLQQKAVPAAVFGSAGGTGIPAASDQPQMGALERLKKRKTAQ